MTATRTAGAAAAAGSCHAPADARTTISAAENRDRRIGRAYTVSVYRLAVMVIRDAEPERDAAACAAVYAPYVTDSVASFEILPPTAPEMARRMEGALAWLVAERDGQTLGYAYGSSHRERAAYRWAADVAVYISGPNHRAGLGRALYDRLFAELRRIGLWTLCAGITQPNDASNGLHRAMGFTPVGTYRRIGWKADNWHDVQWWQLDLRPGEEGPPDELAETTAPHE
jgi:L-amino acid N-acyltransferase YncA